MCIAICYSRCVTPCIIVYKDNYANNNQGAVACFLALVDSRVSGVQCLLCNGVCVYFRKYLCADVCERARECVPPTCALNLRLCLFVSPFALLFMVAVVFSAFWISSYAVAWCWMDPDDNANDLPHHYCNHHTNICEYVRRLCCVCVASLFPCVSVRLRTTCVPLCNMQCELYVPDCVLCTSAEVCVLHLRVRIRIRTRFNTRGVCAERRVQ
jgi:hypothetical protein